MTALATLGVLGLVLLAGMAAVALLVAALGLAGLALYAVVRLVLWALNRSKRNARAREERAAAMRRHPSALGPRTADELERLADELAAGEWSLGFDLTADGEATVVAARRRDDATLELRLLDELEDLEDVDPAELRRRDRATRHPASRWAQPETDLRPFLAAVDEDVRAIAALVAPHDLDTAPRVPAGVDRHDEPTELLPRVLDVSTMADPATVLEVVYPPAVSPSSPVITNSDEPSS